MEEYILLVPCELLLRQRLGDVSTGDHILRVDLVHEATVGEHHLAMLWRFLHHVLWDRAQDSNLRGEHALHVPPAKDGLGGARFERRT